MAERPIDEKIVVMKLDNSDFAKKAAETTTLFGKLKTALGKVTGVNLGKTASDLGNIQNAAGRTNLNALSNSVQQVASRFTNLGIVGMTVLQNLTNRAVNAGMSITRSLTLDQVSSGYQEYETKIKAIGTMLANTEWAGSTLDDVKKTLGELNDYADKTIYNFAQMTENIGRFTAAGVTLEDSAIAIKGLGNLAAVSGSDVNQLNTAMYQMSQALASGKLNLEDWNSLVNAGMAGKKTQDALVATAKAMGKTVNLTDGFRASIQDGWLTSEVLLETLKKFGNDESMTKAATSVRTFSGAMDALKEGIGSGWATTWEHIFGDFEEATVFWTDLSQAVGGWFAKTSDARNELVKGIADAGGFQNIFRGIQNAVKPVIQVFGALKGGFEKAFPPKTTSQLIILTKRFENFTMGLKIGKERMSQLTTIFQGGFSIFSTVFEIVKQLGSAFLEIIPEGAGGGLLGFLEKIALMAIAFNKSVKEGNFLTATIKGLGTIFGAIGEVIGTVVGGIANFSSSLTDNLGRAIDWIMDKLSPVRQAFQDSFSDFGGDDLLGAGTLTAIIAAVTMFGTKVFGIFDSFGDIAEEFAETLEGVKDSVQAFAMGIKIANLVLIAGALTMIAVSLKLLEGIDKEDMTKGITALAVSLGVMLGAVAIISKFDITGGIKASLTIVALAAAVGLMSISLRQLSDINPEKMKTGILGLVGIVGTLVGAITLLSKYSGKIGVGSAQLVALSASVYILAEAVEELSKITGKDLSKSVGALAIIFASLAGFLKVVNGVKFGPGAAIGVIAVAGAIQIMVSAIDKISDINVENLIKGLSTIAILLAEIAIFSKFAGGPSMLVAGAGLLLIAGAINALVPPIQNLGSMSYEELAKGLVSMSLALAAVAGAGLLANGAIGGAIAITVIAGALNMLVPPIQTFANMTWGEIIKGIVGLGLGLAALAGAAVLLTPAVPSMLGFGAALLVLGTAVLAAGAGIALFGTGLATLATLTAASIAAIIGALALLLKGLAELIPATVKFVVDLGLALIKGIGDLVPPLARTVVELIVALLKVIKDHLPEFLELGIDIVIMLIDGIADAAPKLIDAGIRLIIDLIKGLSDAVRNNGPQLVSVVLELLGEILILFLDAGIQIINALLGWIPGVTDATTKIGETAEKYIRDNFGAKEAGQDKGQEFATALNGKQGTVKTAGEQLGNAGKQGLASVKTEGTGKDFAQGFANGVGNEGILSRAVGAAKRLATSAWNAIKTTLDIHSPSRKTDKLGQETGQGFSNGMAKKKETVARTASQLAADAKKGFDKAMDTAEYKFKMGTINSQQYIAEINKIKSSYAKYPELVQKANLEIKKIEEKASKDREKLAKADFNTAKEWISERKYYNEMTTAQELAAWEQLTRKYKAGTEQRKEADREVYRLKQELIKQDFENSKRNMDERKKYNKLSLMEEYEAWEKIMNKYAVGTEQRKEAEYEVYKLKNEINNKLKAINEDYLAKIEDTNQKLIDGEKALNEEYRKAVEDRTKTYYSFAGIFDEVKVKSDVSGQQLIDNLKGQISTFAEWSNNIKSLASKGIDEGLLAELKEMGPKAAGEIAALNTLTESQLTEYSNLWKTKNEQAKIEATAELEQMRINTEAKITQLRVDSAKQLEIYKTEWIKKIQELRKGTVGEFVAMSTSMNQIGKDTILGLMVGMNNMRPQLMELAGQIAQQIRDTINSALDINSPSKATTETGEFVGQGLIVGMANSVRGVVEGAKNLALSAKDSINEFIEGVNLDGINNEIRLKAVIDLDDSSLSRIRSITTIRPDTSFANRTMQSIQSYRRQNDDKSRSNIPVSDKQGDKNVNINQNLVFNSPKMTPSEVARKNLQASRRLVMNI